MSRLHNVLIALDQFANSIFGGYPDETISARCWRLRAQQPYKVLRPVIDWLFSFEPDHCKSSYESEQLRAELPQEYR